MADLFNCGENNLQNKGSLLVGFHSVLPRNLIGGEKYSMSSINCESVLIKQGTHDKKIINSCKVHKLNPKFQTKWDICKFYVSNH